MKNMQTLLLLTSPDMWKSKRSLAEDPLQFKCSGWAAPKKNATVLNHFLAEDPLQSYKKLTGSNKWDKKTAKQKLWFLVFLEKKKLQERSVTKLVTSSY